MEVSALGIALDQLALIKEGLGASVIAGLEVDLS